MLLLRYYEGDQIKGDNMGSISGMCVGGGGGGVCGGCYRVFMLKPKGKGQLN
jgi:hypothetical protein